MNEEFNNRRKIKSRYVQLEECYGFKYGARTAKAFIDSPARYRRETRQIRKVIAQLPAKWSARDSFLDLHRAIKS